MSIGIKNICIKSCSKNILKALLHKFCSIFSQKLQSLTLDLVSLKMKVEPDVQPFTQPPLLCYRAWSARIRAAIWLSIDGHII